MTDDIKTCSHPISNKCFFLKKEMEYFKYFLNAFVLFFFTEYAPLPPNRVKATPVSATAINVTWDVPCCHVFVYTVHYKWVSPDTKGWYIEVT